MSVMRLSEIDIISSDVFGFDNMALFSHVK